MNSMQSYTRRSALAIAFLSLAGCAGGSFGQVLGGLGLPGLGNDIDGRVSYVDSRYQQIQIQPSSGRTVTLDYDSRTQVVYGNQRYSVRNLERGDYVTARVQQDNRGRAYTDLIRVQESARDSRGRSRNDGRYDTGARQVFQGRVRTVDYQRGYFQIQEARGRSYTVVMPFNPTSRDLKRFRQLRDGDRVRVEGVQRGNGRIELYRFR
jgi:hypothetical protein